MSQEEDDKRSVSSAAMETGNLFIKTSFRCEMVVFISSFIHGVKKNLSFRTLSAYSGFGLT